MASWRRSMAAAVAACFMAVPAMGVNLPYQQLVNQAVNEATGNGHSNKANSNKANSSGELQLLQQAMSSLATTKADYKGHRVRAIQAIGAACTILGGPQAMAAAGKPQKNQFASDMQVREAQASLNAALAMAGKQPRVKAHINTALNELKKALAAN